MVKAYGKPYCQPIKIDINKPYLENRVCITQTNKKDTIGFIDMNKIVPRGANHAETHWLGGLGSALTSETTTKSNLDTIWDDRVLTHSHEILRGVRHPA
jgi:hypothetical protein